MIIEQKEYTIRNQHYVIRSAVVEDAKKLSEVRDIIDGETENLDREQGEGFIDEEGFRQLIIEDTAARNHLFLVAEANGEIVGFSRCEGSSLKRLSHKVEFGVCVLKRYWGFAIGRNLLRESIRWADANQIKKVNLAVLETNMKAIKLYREEGFEVEGILKYDKILADGNYYHTVLMGRFNG